VILIYLASKLISIQDKKSQENKNDEVWEYSNAIIRKLTNKENCEKDIKDFKDKFPEYFL